MNMSMSIDDFSKQYSIPPRACAYLRRHFHSATAIISYGRLMFYRIKYQGETVNMKKMPKSVLDLITALDSAGLIRHDITPRSFSLNRLYNKVYHVRLACRIEDLCGENEPSSESFSEEFIRKYDNFKNPIPEQISAVRNALKNKLPQYHCDVVLYTYDLDTSEERRAYMMFPHIDLSVRMAHDEAIWSLKHSSPLPGVLNFNDGFSERRFYELFATLRELYRNPVFKQAEDIRRELSMIPCLPLNSTKKRLTQLADGTYDFTLIEDLDLSVRAFNCLKRANINTVAEIITKPADELMMIKNLNTKSIANIIRAVRRHGFTSFGDDIVEALEKAGHTITIDD